MNYVLIDTANMFFRARHGAHKASDSWTKIGFAMHVTMMAANKVANKFKADHVVFALEGRSWRKDFYPPYKANRAVAHATLTEAEQEEDAMFWEAYDNLTKFLLEKTNCSVIKGPTAEADDIIARWIALHPNDHHTIVSSDTDFVQLVAPNVNQYNGITDQLITFNGVENHKGQKLNFIIDSNSKLKVGKPDPDFVPLENYPQWVLFLKCMRGDGTDNVFSAYPGVRVKGTKNKVGLQEAYDDKNKKGYSWNNLMLQRWVDHNSVEHKVLDDYERNRTLIDLTAQPDHIKHAVDSAIKEQVSHKDVGQVGVRFMQFCGKFDLVKCSDFSDQFSRWLNNTYQGALNDCR